VAPGRDEDLDLHGTVADLALVYCTFDPALKHKGLCAVVVDTRQPGWKAKEISKLGTRLRRLLRFFWTTCTCLRRTCLPAGEKGSPSP